MNNWDFVVWMLGFPFLDSISSALKYKFGKPREYDDTTKGIAALIFLVIWFGVGVALY